MKTGESTNEYGTPISTHICDTCGDEFTMCPAIPDDDDRWPDCLSETCASYDPERDIDILFASDAEIKRKPIVSMDLLRKRKKGVKQSDGTYAADIDVLKSRLDV